MLPLFSQLRYYSLKVKSLYYDSFSCFIFQIIFKKISIFYMGLWFNHYYYCCLDRLGSFIVFIFILVFLLLGFGLRSACWGFEIFELGFRMGFLRQFRRE